MYNVLIISPEDGVPPDGTPVKVLVTLGVVSTVITSLLVVGSSALIVITFLFNSVCYRKRQVVR